MWDFALFLELQRNKDTIRGAALGAEDTVNNNTDANLDCAFVKAALFYTDP